MKVTVMSRAKATRYCHAPHDEKTIMVSISDSFTDYPSAPFQSKENGVKSILRLHFNDVESGADAMSMHDAEQIADFLLYRNKNEENIIVHCDAGQSRSAGVAAAILKYFTGSDSDIFSNPLYKPNMHCYRTTLDILVATAEPEWLKNR